MPDLQANMTWLHKQGIDLNPDHVLALEHTIVRDQRGLPINQRAGNNRTRFEPNLDEIQKRVVESFLAKPVRFRAPISHQLASDQLKFSGHFDAAWKRATSAYREDIKTLEPLRGSRPILVSVGLGPGIHIEPLMERAELSTVIVSEPNAQELALACYFADFPRLDDALRQRGGGLFVLTELTAYALQVHAPRAIELVSPILPGAYLYQQRATDDINDQARGLISELHQLFGLKGFFDDECINIANVAANFSRSISGLIVHRNAKMYCPIIVVGNGPSVRDHIDELGSIADRALIVASGSAIGLLWKHGIDADIWVILENVNNAIRFGPICRTYPEHLARTLVVGTDSFEFPFSTPPEHLAIISRSEISTHWIYPPHLMPAPIVGDTVVNLGTIVAMLQGVPSLWLFGVDFGSRDPTQSHSDLDSLNRMIAEKRDDLGSTETLKIYLKHDRTQRGSLGGTVTSLDQYFRSASLLEGQIRDLGETCQVFLASDGLPIKGTIPILAGEALERLRNLPKIDKLTLRQTFLNRLAPTENAFEALAKVDIAGEIRVLKEVQKALAGIGQGFLERGRKHSISENDGSARSAPSIVEFWDEVCNAFHHLDQEGGPMRTKRFALAAFSGHILTLTLMCYNAEARLGPKIGKKISHLMVQEFTENDLSGMCNQLGKAIADLGETAKNAQKREKNPPEAELRYD